MEYNLNIDDYIGRWGYSKNYIRNQMSGLKKKPVNVRISSLGGSVDDALDIRQQFVDHGEVTAYLYGYVASSATIIATGANKVCMSKFAFYLVHKVSNWVDAWGSYNADQIQSLIEDLKANKLENDKMDLVLAQLYADKCKKKVSDILEVLKEGKWLTAKEALEFGFIDEILEEEDEQKTNTSNMKEKFNMLGFPELPECTNKDNDNDTEGKVPGWFSKFMKGIGKQNNSNIQTTTIKVMKKDFVRVNTILNVEGVEIDNEGKCNLTENQVKSINDKLDTMENDITSKDNEIAQLKEQIQNLKNNDGDETTHIEGEETTDSSFDDVNKANELYNGLKNII